MKPQRRHHLPALNLSLQKAYLKVESTGVNGRLQNFEISPQGHYENGLVSSSPSSSFHKSEESDSNNQLHKFVRNDKLEEGFKLLEGIVYYGEIPDIIACASLICGFCKKGKTREGARVMEIIEDSGAVPDVITYNVLNTILRSLCDSGKLKVAMEVLDQQLQRECCPDEGTLDEVIKLLNNMPSYGCQPNVITHNIILRSMCSTGRWMHAERFLADMVCKGCSPSVLTFNIVINFRCQKDLLGRVIDVLEKMPEHVSRGCYPDIVTYNTLLTALCKDGRVDAAVEILNQLSTKGCLPVLITYNTLVDGLSKVGKTDQAIKLLDEMRAKGSFFHDFEKMGIRPNVITFNSIMLALCKAWQTDRAIDFLAYMVMRGCKPTESTYTILIEGIAYEGCLRSYSMSFALDEL
ncbi:hypothetical protein DITRI_Ditri05aG0144100 [Diplodiscus trichospermus]